MFYIISYAESLTTHKFGGWNQGFHKSYNSLNARIDKLMHAVLLKQMI